MLKEDALAAEIFLRRTRLSEASRAASDMFMTARVLHLLTSLLATITSFSNTAHASSTSQYSYASTHTPPRIMGWFWADAEPSAPVAPHPLPRGSNAAPPPGCPMHEKLSAPSLPPPPPTTTPAPPPDSACPYKPSDPSSTASSSTSTTLSKLNPLNYMPRTLDNTRAAVQTISLDLDREPSTIPRGDGSGSNWEYPSPQQMYNAMLRKGYHDTPAEDVPAMVAVHNFLNEGAWGEILDWETRFHGGLKRGWEICSRGEENAPFMMDILQRKERMAGGQEPKQPSLVRFMGRPDEPTPKARMVQFMGWLWPTQFATEPPFDRHDWYVRRHGLDGRDKEVRYIIDYYSGPPEPSGEPVFYLDVRPAVDGPTAACERLLRWGGDVWWRASGGTVREELQKAQARRMA